MSKLTDKQEVFCREYIIDFNATQAAIRAGYSEKTARSLGAENLTKPDVSNRIAELMQERSNSTKINAEWVLKSAKRVYDRCMQDTPVLDREGNPVLCETENGELAATYKFDSSGANKALEIIGKHVDVQAFLTKQETSIKLTDDFDALLGDANDD